MAANITGKPPEKVSFKESQLRFIWHVSLLEGISKTFDREGIMF